MLYRFIIISNEVEDFMREIKIDANSTFLQFHNAIIESCGYDNGELTSFTICGEGWEKGQEITLEEMDTSSEQDSYVMATTRLTEFLLDEKQHLIYTFDPIADRMFFIELSQIIPREHLQEPVVSRSQGNPPKQRIDLYEMMNLGSAAGDGNSEFIDEDMTSEGFDDEDLELSGLDISDGEF
jgi:hypothetical protein